MANRLVVGEIAKPQGVTGSVKVKPYTDDVSRFKTLKKVYIDGVPYRVAKVSVSPDAVILHLRGVADRNAAEILRGKSLEVDREDAAPLAEGRYYIVDVIGSRVVDESGREYGVIRNIDAMSFADVYTLEAAGKTVMFPLLRDLLVSVDIENKTMVVRGKRFAEVAVYED